MLLVVLAGSAFGAYLLYIRSTPPPQPTIVGHAFFVSSGLLTSQNSNQGITDKLQIDLHNLPAPRPGTRYYAWLLNDHHIDSPAVALGSLPLQGGQVTMTYSDPQHNNLLANYGRFLITEEGANPPPINPSLDTTTWRYYAAFSSTPNPGDTTNHFSVLDHLRHLLSQDPALVRILDYLDGSVYVQADVPPGTPLYIDPTIARVALLEFDEVHQQPPGYLKHIGNHLRVLTSSPGATAAQHALAIQIGQAINNVQGWLAAVHTDAVTLEKMNNGQLSQPGAASMLNDLFKQANAAFVGQFDANTSTVKEGVVQIHYKIQGLATFYVTPCTTKNGKNTCAS